MIVVILPSFSFLSFQLISPGTCCLKVDLFEMVGSNPIFSIGILFSKCSTIRFAAWAPSCIKSGSAAKTAVPNFSEASRSIVAMTGDPFSLYFPVPEFSQAFGIDNNIIGPGMMNASTFSSETNLSNESFMMRRVFSMDGFLP